VKYRVVLTTPALEDLRRLYRFIVERELARDGGDLELAARAYDAIMRDTRSLERSPHRCRRCGDSEVRELVISFGASGYVALFDIVGDARVEVLAVRHQRELAYEPRKGTDDPS